MSNDVMIPDEFKNAPVLEEFAHLNPQEESLTEGIGSSYAVVGYRGKNWTFRYKGATHTIFFPQTAQQVADQIPAAPSNYIDVVILRKARQKSKSYYPKAEGGASFSPDDIDAHKKPVCSSINGIVPDAGVEKKQSETCALCPHNVWGPQPSGRDGRACQDRMRLAVIIMPGMITPILGAPLLEPMFLPVPPASLQGLSLLGDEMEKNGKHFSTYVTRIIFKADKTWPEFQYKVAKMLTKAESGIVLKLRADPMSMRIIGESLGPGQALSGPETMKVISPPPGQANAPLEALKREHAAALKREHAAAPNQTEVSARALVQEAERRARIAAVRAAEPPPPKPAPAAPDPAPVVVYPPAAPSTMVQDQSVAVAALARVAELQAQIAALKAANPPVETTGVPGTAPDLDVGLGGIDAAAEEDTPDLDDIIRKMMPKPQ